MKIRCVGMPVAIAVVAVFGAWHAGLNAQQAAAPATRILVTTTQVKPGMGDAYRALIQSEAVPAYKKAGVPWRHVYTSGPLSGQGGRFVSVVPVTNFAQFDQPGAIQRALGQDGAAKFQAKLQPMILSTHNFLQTLVANASLQSYSTTPPPLVRVATIQLLPGKGGEFATITSEEYLPALKKAGVTDYLLFTVNYGAPTTQRVIVENLSKYADLDQPAPLIRALGQEAANKINQRRNALITSTEVAVLRLVPELSYGAPVRPKT